MSQKESQMNPVYSSDGRTFYWNYLPETFPYQYQGSQNLYSQEIAIIGGFIPKDPQNFTRLTTHQRKGCDCDYRAGW